MGNIQQVKRCLKKKRKSKNIHDRLMNKLTKVRAKTGRFIDWQKVDETTMANPLDFIGLLKRVWGILMGDKKNEDKSKAVVRCPDK